MTRVRTTERGFPASCPLPYSVAQEVLRHTNRNSRRVCSVCKNMADKTKVFRENCKWWQGQLNAFDK